MSSPWQNPQTNPPPLGIPVECLSDDMYGDFVITLMRKDYKQKPTNTKRFFRSNGKYWRWVYVDGFFSGMSVDQKDVPSRWRMK